MKQGEESAAVEKIKYSRGSGTQIFSGTASGRGGPGFPAAKSGGGSRVGDPQNSVGAADTDKKNCRYHDSSFIILSYFLPKSSLYLPLAV